MTTNIQNNDKSGALTRVPVLKRIADAYGQTSVAYFFNIVQPLGVFLAALGLLLAIYELQVNRKVREASLLTLAMERLDVARATDVGKSSTVLEAGKRLRKCTKGGEQLSAEDGQIAILERINILGIDLRDINAQDLNLVVPRDRRQQSPGINLEGAKLINANFHNSNLQHADLSGAKLQYAEFKEACMEKILLKKADLTRASLIEADATRADFSGADLTRAWLSRTNLSHAKFGGADFSETRLRNANITGADLKDARNLTQPQLDKACANPKKQAPEVPPDLKWKERDCP